MAQTVQIHLEDNLDGGTRSPGSRASGSDPDTAKIRAWSENGHPVSDRGRIHQHIRDAHYAAH